MNHFLDRPPSPEELATTLSPHELDVLAGLLVSDATPDECMNISELDGFLTALAIGPRLTPAGQWLPIVWGRENELRFSPDEAANCARSIARLMNDIGRGFEESPQQFAPIIEMIGPNGEVVTTAEDWCAGFMAGVLLNREDWKPLIRDQDKGLALMPIIALGTSEGLEALEKQPDPDAEYDKLVDILHDFVPLIHAYWRSHSRNAATGIPAIRPRSLRPGRNAPCPCGSGRKFKRCCADQPSP